MFVRYTIANDNGDVFIYGTCGHSQNGIHEFTVYVKPSQIQASIVERAREVAVPFVLSRGQMFDLLSSPKVPRTSIVDAWREVCGSYPTLIGG